MSLLKRSVTIFAILLLAITFKSEGNILVMNGLTHEHIAIQGETKREVIELKNISDTPQSVQLYQKDYWYSHTGETKHDDPGTMERSNAKWISINPVFLTLAANETAQVEFTVTVPKIDSLNGTYWSVIMVEGLNPPDTTQSERGIKINTVVRYAIQVITNIGDTGERNLSFLNFNLKKENGQTLLEVDMQNTGQRVLRFDTNLETYNANGASSGVFKADKRKLYPGTSARITLDLSKLKTGNYSGVLIADCGDEYVFGSNLTLDIKDE
jgi:hypothetical protein